MFKKQNKEKLLGLSLDRSLYIRNNSYQGLVVLSVHWPNRVSV